MGKYDTYIVVINSMRNLTHFLNVLKDSSSWNFDGKYLISLDGNIDRDRIFEIVIKYPLLNVNILIKDNFNIEIFTYFPYSNESCGTNFKSVKLEDSITNIFPEKIPNDLTGCEIKLTGVRIVPYILDITSNRDNPKTAGLEVTIIYNILKKLNFTQTYLHNTYPHWGYMLPDGNFTMMYKFLYDRNVDIIFGMMIGNITMSKYFDATVPHIDTTAVWFVPVALPIAQWKNLTVIFDATVWTAIFIVIILNGTIWWVLGRKREKSESYNELSLCLMGALYILLQGSFETPKSWKLRFVVIIWSIASLLLFTAHQCQLTGILTSPLYDHQISNLREMVDSKLDFGFYPVLAGLYNASANKVHRKLLKKYKPCPLTVECMNRTAFQRDFATIKNKREAAYLLPKYYAFPNGKPMVYNFEESEFVVWCKYYMAKGYPFLHKINNMILYMQSTGFIAKWEKDIVPRFRKNVEVTELEPLSLDHLQGAFFLLIFGHLLANIIFIFEKCYLFRFYRKRIQI